jgi:DNA invertase Pin-like site-specific DNA recombinase
MYYAYISSCDDEQVDAKKEIDSYAKKQQIRLDRTLIDEQANKIHWEKRDLYALIHKTAKKGDTILAYEAGNIARSTLQLLEVFEALEERGITLHLIKYNETFTPEKMTDTQEFLQLVQHIESEFVAKRTTDALARRRAAGLPLGRPKGRKNKSRKLDKYKAEIKKYLALNISKASIAKLVGCHAQTLYNYLDDKNLLTEDDRTEA